MRKLFYSLFFFMFSATVSSQSVTFNRTYSNSIETLFNINETASGYLASIITIYPGGNFSKVCILKIDFNGDTLWQKFYGDSTEWHINYALIKTYDNNFLSGAYNYHNILNRLSIELLKLDTLGDSIWKKEIFAPIGYEYESGYLIETNDKGFLISGEIVDTSITDGDAFILKTDSLGNEQWHRIYGGSGFDAFFSSAQLPDNSYISLGWTRSFGNGTRDWYIVKTDSAGNFIWQKSFGTFDEEGGIGITSLFDGNYLLAGGGWLNGLTFYGVLTKIDTAGNILKQKYYNNFPASEFWWARENNDNTIIASGARRNQFNQLDEGWIAKLDSGLNMLWTRSFGMNNNQAYFRDVKQTTDGGYICPGFVFTGASGGQDAWIVKLDSMGCDSAGCPTLTSVPFINAAQQKELTLFPNPATQQITILFNRSVFSAARIRIFDLMGKQVYQQPAFIQKQVSIPVYQLPSGIYIVEINCEGKKERVKFVKQ